MARPEKHPRPKIMLLLLLLFTALSTSAFFVGYGAPETSRRFDLLDGGGAGCEQPGSLCREIP